MMRRTVTTLALAVALLALVATAPTWAGGDKCRQEAAQAAAAKAAQHEKAEAIKKAGWTGMEVEAAEEGGYRVTYVAAGTPAAEAGVRVGDRLVAYQGIALTEDNEEALHAAKKARRLGSRVSYTLERDGGRRNVTLTLVEVPDTVVARWLDGESAQGVTVAQIDG